MLLSNFCPNQHWKESKTNLYGKMKLSIIWRMDFLSCISISVGWSLICCSCLDAKISEGMLPPTTILKVLTLLSKMMPKAKLFPYKDLSELIFREPGKRKLVGNLICGDHSNKHVLEILNSIPNLPWLVLSFTGSLQCYFLRWSNTIKNWHGTLKCHSRYWVTVGEGKLFAFAHFLLLG